MKFIERVLRFFLIIAVVLMFVEVVVEVSSRFIFHYPLPWGAEVSQTLLVWLTFIGSAAAFLRNDHVGIEFLVERLPDSIRKLSRRFNLLVIGAFLVCGTWSGIAVVRRTWRSATAALQIPAGILYMALPVGFALMIVFALWMLFTGKPRSRFEETEETPL
ncbi:C4-dicarboxylate ABC transporter permease [Synergistales bacterium]|nr:C4-dicarboxylate ABC transporter permease [Synergistales bacterium]